MPSLTVGLTGGIASGKSTAGEAFVACGVPIIDADQVARDVVQPGSPALEEIRQHFGDDVIDTSGQLDRRRMRELVFADPERRRQLESITHPRIAEQLGAWRDQQSDTVVVLMVPILVESGMNRLVDRVLLIDCAASVQRQRLIERDGITPQLADQMIAAQMPAAQRREHADDIIDNDADQDALTLAVTDLVQRYRNAAASAAAIEAIRISASDFRSSN